MQARYYSEPELEEPVMMAGWPGMGLLAKITAEHLIDQLKAELFAEINTYRGFITYREGLAEESTVRHRFYSVPSKDLVICVGDDQPHGPGEVNTLAEEVLNVAEMLKVRRIYTVAAFMGPHQRGQRILGIVNMAELQGYLKEYDVDVAQGEGNVTGLNGLLIGAAQRRGIEGICLMGPILNAHIPQPGAAKDVLEVLTQMLGIEIDMEKLDTRQEEIDEYFKRSLDEMRKAKEREDRSDLSYIG